MAKQHDMQDMNASAPRDDRKLADIRYAPGSDSRKLDLYLPEHGEKPFPCIVHIHGGAFCMGDKADHQVEPWLQATSRGYVLASINYRLSDEAIFPAVIQDCKAAIRFLRANADVYGIDPERIAVVGGSAGGYNVAMLCVTDADSFPEDRSIGWGEQSSAVQCGIAWFPVTDFLQMDAQLLESGLLPCNHSDADSPESKLMGGQITRLDPAWMAQSNPLTYVTDHPAPMYIQHGRIDHSVPYQQSVVLAERIRAVAGDSFVQLDLLPDADHGAPQFETPENMEKMFGFLDRYIGISAAH